ncbi:hypothetical protein B0H34DRAFT_715728 [Crassisporium funariophilum]|nr:hypothetical protein B0H34DRAFT_715728 [Crassisporium funariophilum]
MSDLPLKIRADIRDRWDSTKAPIHEVVESLSKTLGFKIEPQVQWSTLYSTMKDHFPDKSTFVPAVSCTVVAFYERLSSRLESESHSEWTERLLEVLAKKPPGSSWPLRVEASSTPGPRPRVTWKADVGAFYLKFPDREPVLQATLDAGFDRDLDDLLSPATAVNDDEWANITELEAHTPEIPQTVNVSSQIAVQSKSSTERLPNVDVLPRPSELFKTSAPYILIVDASTKPFTVQCSHQPSIELLASYFKKWGKTNPNDIMKRNYLQVELIESAFCFGVIDGLTIEPYSNYRTDGILNPALVLAFIEGTLGYKRVHTDGFRWVYTSEIIMK